MNSIVAMTLTSSLKTYDDTETDSKPKPHLGANCTEALDSAGLSPHERGWAFLRLMNGQN